jgi:hypothetical protein
VGIETLLLVDSGCQFQDGVINRQFAEELLERGAGTRIDTTIRMIQTSGTLETVYSLRTEITVTSMTPVNGEFNTMSFPIVFSVLDDTRHQPTISHEVEERMHMLKTKDRCYEFDGRLKIPMVTLDEWVAEEKARGVRTMRNMMEPLTQAIRAEMGPGAQTEDAEAILFQPTPTDF